MIRKVLPSKNSYFNLLKKIIEMQGLDTTQITNTATPLQ